MRGARAFAVVGDTRDRPRVAYLKKDAVVDEAMLAELGDIAPTRVFRFAAACEESGCAQYRDGCCSLGRRLAEQLDPVVDALPSCQIRPTCRWHAEQGGAACLRCPQVVTLVPHGSALSKVARPED